MWPQCRYPVLWACSLSGTIGYRPSTRSRTREAVANILLCDAKPEPRERHQWRVGGGVAVLVRVLRTQYRVRSTKMSRRDGGAPGQALGHSCSGRLFSLRWTVLGCIPSHSNATTSAHAGPAIGVLARRARVRAQATDVGADADAQAGRRCSPTLLKKLPTIQGERVGRIRGKRNAIVAARISQRLARLSQQVSVGLALASMHEYAEEGGKSHGLATAAIIDHH